MTNTVVTHFLFTRHEHPSANSDASTRRSHNSTSGSQHFGTNAASEPPVLCNRVQTQPCVSFFQCALTVTLRMTTYILHRLHQFGRREQTITKHHTCHMPKETIGAHLHFGLPLPPPVTTLYCAAMNGSARFVCPLGFYSSKLIETSVPIVFDEGDVVARTTYSQTACPPGTPQAPTANCRTSASNRIFARRYCKE